MQAPLLSNPHTGSSLARMPATSQSSSSSSSEITIQEIKRRALSQPLEDLKRVRTLGATLVWIARPRMILTKWIKAPLCLAWDATSLSWLGLQCAQKANTLVAGTINVAISSYDQVKLTIAQRQQDQEQIWLMETSIRERKPLTGRDISEWRGPAPATLVQARQVAERINRYVPCSSLLGKAIVGVNRAYEWYYQEESPIHLPAVPAELEHLLLGNGSENYLPFAQRVDHFLCQSFIQKEVIDLPHSAILPQLGAIQFFNRLSALMQKDIATVFNKITYQTLQKTASKRLAWIESVEGMVLRMLYDITASKMPSRETVIRDLSIGLLTSQFFFLPIDWATEALADQLPFPLNQIDRVPDFMDLAAGLAGSLTSSILTPLVRQVDGKLITMPAAYSLKISQHLLNFSIKQVLLQGGTLGLEHGPLIYHVINQDMTHWAAEGNRRIDQFSTKQGLQNLAIGEKPEAQSDDLQTILDAQRGYLLPIFAEFTLGTLGRMCEDSRLGPAKGPLGLLQLGLRSLLLGYLFESASLPVGKENLSNLPATPSRAFSEEKTEIPGLTEAKAAFRDLIDEMKKVFFAELKSQLQAELERQKKSAQDAFSDTVENQRGILRMQASAISTLTAGMISEERAYGVLNSPATLLNGLRQRMTGQVAEEKK